MRRSFKSALVKGLVVGAAILAALANVTVALAENTSWP